MTTRIFFTVQSDAQAFCDKTHASMIASSPEYAKSVTDGQTVRWDAPRQDLDAQGKPVGDFFVIVQDRATPTLTPGEIAKVVPASITPSKE